MAWSIAMFDAPARGTRSSQSSQLRVRVHPRAGGEEVPVAEGAVDAADRGPDLVGARRVAGEGGALPRIGAVPGVGGALRQGMRRAGEQVPLPVGGAPLDLADLLADGDHRVAEPVQLLLR